MPVSRAHVAEHIRNTCVELRDIATEARFEVLSHILGMAVLEAHLKAIDSRRLAILQERENDCERIKSNLDDGR